MSAANTELACTHQGCNKIYSTKYNLKRHLETGHSAIKRFHCRICGKGLSSKQNLDEHSFTHSQLKPFACPETCCGQVFRQRSQLANHKKLHEELQALSKRARVFKELKVKFKQLTSLLVKDILKVEELVLTDEADRPRLLPLPLIRPSISMVILPSFLDL